MKSMTGYGQATCEGEGVVVTVEMTSLNSRYCDVQVRLPWNLGIFEPRIIQFIKSKFSRGRFHIKIAVEKTKEPETFYLDMEKVKAYVNTLKFLKDAFGFKDEITLSLLVHSRWIWEEREIGAIGEVPYALIESALVRASDELEKMREVEGGNIKKDITLRIHEIETYVEYIETAFLKAEEVLKKRLVEKAYDFFKDTSIKLDQKRFEQELFYYIERMDIQEELLRMRSHLNQIRNEAEKNTPAGKRMEFILQELNREINTISSKSPCLEIRSTVVSVKVELEKIREQIQNIE